LINNAKVYYADQDSPGGVYILPIDADEEQTEIILNFLYILEKNGMIARSVVVNQKIQL